MTTRTPWAGGRDWQQEHYQTGSGEARKRARFLRRAGYRVLSSQMGEQIGEWGSMRMTMLTIYPGSHADLSALPVQS